MAVIKKNTDSKCFQRGEQSVKLYSAERKANGFYSEEKLHTCASKTTKNFSHSPQKTKMRTILWPRFWSVHTQRKWNQHWTDVSATVFIVALLSIIKIHQLLLPVWDPRKIKPVKMPIMEVGEVLGVDGWCWRERHFCPSG